MNDFFDFKKLITNSIIKILYIVGMVLITLSGIIAMFTNSTIMGVLGGILVLTFGNVFWRLGCEGTIIIFSIHELLHKIASKK